MTELSRLSRGVWRDPDTVTAPAARAAALLTICPVDTVITALSAARFYGFWLPTDPPVNPLQVIVHTEIGMPSARAWNRRPEILACRRILCPDEITTAFGLPITTEARTWFELARQLAMPDLVAAGDSCLRGGTSLAELTRIVHRAGHRPGVRRARAALPLLDARSRSRPESHLRYALVSRNLPAPGVNEAIHDAHGGWLGEPDLGYDDVRLALEYNGADHAGVQRMRKDITRSVTFSAEGWRTEVFGPAEVFGRPDQIASLVRVLRHERRDLGPARRSA